MTHRLWLISSIMWAISFSLQVLCYVHLGQALFRNFAENARLKKYTFEKMGKPIFWGIDFLGTGFGGPIFGTSNMESLYFIKQYFSIMGNTMFLIISGWKLHFEKNSDFCVCLYIGAIFGSCWNWNIFVETIKSTYFQMAFNWPFKYKTRQFL